MLNAADFHFRRRADYRRTFRDNDAGARVLRDLLKFCNVGAQCHVSGDPAETAFNEGKRRVALRIVRALNMSDEEIVALAQQQQTGD